MKRLATLLLVAGFAQATTQAVDPRVVVVPASPLPTSPQVPPPVIQQVGGVLPAPAASRVVAPIRERAGYLPKASSPVRGEMPLPTGYTTANSGPACAPDASCGGSRSCLSQLKAWLCFQPTTRDALPKCRPQPYIGPVVGTFTCTSAAGCGNGNGCGAAGCAPGVAAGGTGANGGQGGRFGSLLSGRGGRGECVPPADDAMPGYRFAPATQPPAAVGVYAQPTTQTSYKPAPTVAPAAKPSADPSARPITRP